ncbi:MAG: MerR family transcriptional regulator, partial [Alcanivorax sp.]|nr:MerR family transcriptional regulator [Alcanivorax sp.]
DELDRMIEECEQGHTGECRVIEVLSDHQECSGDH